MLSPLAEVQITIAAPAEDLRAVVERLRGKLAADVADAIRIRGNSRSSAGDPWARLAANVGAAQRIIDRQEAS